jgi:hypothetical protein
VSSSQLLKSVAAVAPRGRVSGGSAMTMTSASPAGKSEGNVTLTS